MTIHGQGDILRTVKGVPVAAQDIVLPRLGIVDDRVDAVHERHEGKHLTLLAMHKEHAVVARPKPGHAFDDQFIRADPAADEVDDKGEGGVPLMTSLISSSTLVPM